jgi:hypothetical protein
MDHSRFYNTTFKKNVLHQKVYKAPSSLGLKCVNDTSFSQNCIIDDRMKHLTFAVV